MLQLTLRTNFHDFLFEARKIISHVTTRMMIVAAGVLCILSLAVAASIVYSGAPSCAAGQSLLVYSRYDRKGIADGITYSCGTPHQTCVARPDGSAFDCSPFMAPKGSLTK